MSQTRFNIFVNYLEKPIEYSLVINIMQEDIFCNFLLKRVGRKRKKRCEGGGHPRVFLCGGGVRRKKKFGWVTKINYNI